MITPSGLVKNIGKFRPGKGNKFVEQLKNLFIILNKEGKVVGWQLTKTTAFIELRDVFLWYKTHVQRANKKLKPICVDDCC